MKLSKIALAALMVAGAGSSFAQTQPKGIVCDKSTDVAFVNTCVPYTTFYVAGASALGDAISTVLPSYFNTDEASGGRAVVKVIDNITANGVGAVNPTNNGAAGNGVKAWYGMSRADLTGGTTKPVFVVYNSYMGSAAGVSQVLVTGKALESIPESRVVKVGPQGTAANTCVDYSVGSTTQAIGIAGTSSSVAKAANTVACSTGGITQADLAISDVNVKELSGMYSVAAKATLSKFDLKPMAMQGFGVAVNNNFYAALQKAQKDAGTLPACTDAAIDGTVAKINTTAACQPNVTSVQYSSLASLEGSIKSADGFIPGDTTQLTLARRDNLSGTQASSNIFFLANSCNKLDIKSKINALGGALTPLSIENKPSTATGLTVVEGVQTSNVEAALKSNANGYAIGVVTLTRNISGYRWVKVDGASPNFDKAGVAIPYARMNTNMLDGSWPFQMTAYAIASKASRIPGPKALKAEFINAMMNDLGDASKHDLAAIGYFNGTTLAQAEVGTPAKQTLVSRVGGNNCSPLIVRNNS